MKKFLCLLLSLVMVMSLFTACGDDNGDSSDKNDDSSVMSDDSKKNLSAAELVDIAKDAANGSVMTSELKFTLEAKEGFGEMPEFTSKFGWTENKLGLSLKMSALTTADEKGKLSISIHGEDGTEIVGLNDLIVIKEDIFIPTASINEILDFVVDIAKESGEEDLDTGIDSIKETWNGKKYIQINVPSLVSLINGTDSGVSTEEFDIEETIYSTTGFKLDEITQAIKDLYNNETLKASAEKEAEKFEIVTVDGKSVNVKFNEKDVVTFVDSIVAFVTDNADIFAGEIFEARKNSYEGEDKDEVYNDDYKKEITDGLSSLKEEWDDAKVDVEEFCDEYGFDFNLNLDVDSSDNSFFDLTNDISLYDKAESGNKISFSSKSSVDKSSESIADISATDCISIESLLAQIGNLFGSEEENEYDDDYDYDYDYDYSDDYDYDYDYSDDYDFDYDYSDDYYEEPVMAGSVY